MMMDNLDFSEDEIREQLAIMGYENIPKHRLREFKRDLDELIRHGEWKSLTPTPQRNATVSPTAALQPSPPAYIKEKVTPSRFEDSGQGFFLHAGHTGHDRHSGERGWQPGPQDSYAQHSVAPTLRLARGAPGRLQVEPDPDDTLPPPLTDSCVSSPDPRGRRFIRRKVLRKCEGQSLVCDESIYSEDSDSEPQQDATMYKNCSSHWDDDSDSDKNSLYSSFWSDGEEEEEEEIEVEVENCVQVEEEPEPDQGSRSRESPEGGGSDGDGRDELRSSACDSPALSVMTSGYGTIRPGEAGGPRPDHAGTESDLDSRGDPCETPDREEDDRFLPRLDFELTEQNDGKSEEGGRQEEQEKVDHLRAESENGERSPAPEEEQRAAAGSEDPDESSSNEGVKFIDSKADFGWMTYAEMCEAVEGNLRQEKTDATSRLEEELEELHLSPSPQRDGETEDEDEPGQSDAQSSEEGFSMSAIRAVIQARRDKPKSFIRPAAQATKKTDPVTKYYQYKQFWDMFKLPGESDRRVLRLEVKERLEYQPPPPKPRRVYAPNTYVVPTEKKRLALRWQIRNDLANRLVPYKFGCLL